MISAIVAVDNNWGIGYNNQLLESIPEDLKRFKQITTGKAVVMGRKTWESLPKKPLPKRENIVISSIPVETPLVWTMSIEEIKCVLANTEDDYFIIGGGQLYKELLPFCNKVYVTKINKDHKNVDTYFPNLDESDEWTWGFKQTGLSFNDFTYEFWEYDRI